MLLFREMLRKWRTLRNSFFIEYRAAAALMLAPHDTLGTHGRNIREAMQHDLIFLRNAAKEQNA